MKIIVMIMGLFLSVSSLASVDVDINGNLYRYQLPVRLSNLLTPVVSNGDWYWPACVLYKQDDGTIEQQRHDVLNEIDAMIVELRPQEKKAMALRSLRQQIESWKLAKRLPVNINYDAARLDIRQNPMLQPGRYILNLTGRPQEIWMSGLVKTPGAYEYQPQKTPYDYDEGISVRDDADNDVVYVIAPDGDISKRNIAYWNRAYNQLMPGSQIYIPLSSWLFFWDLDEFNEKVAELAVHRVLL